MSVKYVRYVESGRSRATSPENPTDAGGTEERLGRQVPTRVYYYGDA